MGSVQENLDLAVRHFQAGEFARAEMLNRQILHEDPRHAGAHNNLALILRKQNKVSQALVHWQTAIDLDPDFAEAHNNLANTHRERGNLEAAIACYRRVVQLRPSDAEGHHNLAMALRQQGKLAEAVACWQEAVRLKPDWAEAFNSLGIALQQQGKLDEAITCWQKAVQLRPDLAEAFNNLGLGFEEAGKTDEAIASLQEAIRLQPDYADAYNNLGVALTEQGKLDEAIGNYQRALGLQPGLRSAHSNLGGALQRLGDIAGAEQAFRQVLREDPRHAEALWELARLLGGKLPADHCALLERRLAEPDLSDADRAKLLFGLAEVCDAQGQYEQAAALLRQANALMLALRRRQGQGYNLDDHARFVANLMAIFTPAFFERVRGFGLETERPVFIIGLPRSGTTLTEQILAAHSQVFGAGELFLAREDFLALGTQPTDQSVRDLPGVPGEAFRRLAQRHLDRLAAMNRTATRVVDKMPENYFYLGLLAALFPRAKFIHCRRDLRDVAVSCWMTHFDRLAWANDPGHILARFREYQRLMEHWRAVLPVAVLEVQYEETVADLPRMARRLLEWCGLDWQPACLAFHESKKPVSTASVIQVRRPVHTKSVARWRNYQRDLGPMLAALMPLLERNG